MAEQLQSLSYEDRIEQVRKRFVSTLPNRLDDISGVVREAPEAVVGETHARKVHRLLHDVGGNAAMLEFDGIETLVRQGVDIAERVDGAGTYLTEADKTALEAIIKSTHTAAAQLRKR